MAIETRNTPSWVCLLLLSSLLPAQDEKATGEKPSVGEVPIPSDTQGPTTELTLRDALLLGRRNNTNLKVGELLPLQARQDLLLAHASFDPELYSRVSMSKSTGFPRQTRAPALMMRSAFPRVWNPIIAMTSIPFVLGFSLICRLTAKPSTLGIIRSRSTM